LYDFLEGEFAIGFNAHGAIDGVERHVAQCLESLARG
jgi:hypothetical protein